MTAILLPERKILVPRLEFPRWLRFPRGVSDERVTRMLSPLGGGGLTPLGVSAGAAFSPLQISGLVAWYDFSDISTLYADSARTTPVTADSDPIGGVTDKSGNAKHLSQGTASKRPTYKTGIQSGKSAALFDGSDDIIGASGAISAKELFVVVRHTAYSFLPPIFANGGRDFYQIRADTSSTYRGASSPADSNDFAYGGTFKVNNIATTSYTMNVTHLVNAIATSAVSVTPVFGYGSYSSRIFQGYEMEILGFSATIGASDRSSLLSYLNAKWAIY